MKNRVNTHGIYWDNTEYDVIGIDGHVICVENWDNYFGYI